jgi:hypothetical protein
VDTGTDTRTNPTRIAAFLLSLLLFACSSPPPPPPPKPRHVHHKPVPPQPVAEEIIEQPIEYTPDAYLLHLSLAELTLAAVSDISASAADFDIVRDYSEQIQDGNILQPAIILEYSLKNRKEHQRIAIPFTMPHETNDFLGLEDAMARLNSLSYTMYDLRPAVITLPPPELLENEGDDKAEVEMTINSRLQPLIQKATPLAPMAQSRIELQLTRFFIQHRYKEPAYLAIENAKQSLATAAETSRNSDVTRVLSKLIDAQESLLYKTMPFTFHF